MHTFVAIIAELKGCIFGSFHIDERYKLISITRFRVYNLLLIVNAGDPFKVTNIIHLFF